MQDNLFLVKQEKYLEVQGDFKDHFDKVFTVQGVEALGETATHVQTAGRIISLRVMGKILFAHLYDVTGKIQICVRRNEDDEGKSFETFIHQVSIGDFVGVRGDMFTTKTGELTLRVQSFSLLNKALRPMPEKFHGLEDVETRYRQRYLDLIVNRSSREIALKRIEMVKIMRRYLEDERFYEVETPILQTTPSGALAKPFVTHHQALDISCVLRIAPETYLKRCIGAGFDRVFEFARCFRNEGISTSHLQDFTMLEFYAAYWNATKMRDFVEGMIRHLIAKLFGSHQVTLGNHAIDFSNRWPVYEFKALVLKYTGIDLAKTSTAPALLSVLKETGIRLDDAEKLSFANLADALYKKMCRPHLIQPCFLVKYPAEMAPLARRCQDDPEAVDMFQFVVNGVEVVKAYSELVDPLDQRRRFEEQAKAREAGDVEAMPLDEDYLLAMEHGFPPITGVGIGIDRLTMVLCGCDNIKETLLFPLLRPVSG